MWIFWESTQKARKEYFCDRCCSWIGPGDIYERKVWVPRLGRFFVMREHVDPWCPEWALEEMRGPEPVEQTISFGYAVTLRAVILQRADGGTETKFVPHMTLVGGTDDSDDFPDCDMSDDIPF
ncbi:MAG: hypothetical protein WA058_03910 [Minisyncoccia bacterium]